MKIFLFLFVTTVVAAWALYYWYNNNVTIKNKTDSFLSDNFNTNIENITKKVIEQKDLALEKTKEYQEELNDYKGDLDKTTSELAYSEPITPIDFDKSKWEPNTTINSFSTSKKNLERYVYDWKELERTTYYCWCDYTATKNVKTWNCWYVNDWKYITRSKKIEWEHIVPAENFWNSFEEWREWHKSCVTSKWKEFTWRNCARKANEEFRYMESDMYNLVPAIWALNALRSNYQIAEIEGEERKYGKCDFEIDSRKMEPPLEQKWDIARIYLYMEYSYPWKWIISNKNEKLIQAWNSLDPISKEECNRYEAIKKVQKNENIILKEACKTI